MRTSALFLLLAGCALAAPRRAAAGAAGTQLSAEEKAFCESELDVVERRARIFRAQGLGPREIAKRNEIEQRALDECHERFRERQRRMREDREDQEEAARRAGPNATELERERAWRELRRERLASRNPAQLDADERAELAAGTQDEVATTHGALDAAHARDAAFMRSVHSALACYHQDRRDDLQAQLASEEALVKLGTGDRQKVYRLRSALRESDDVLARSREAARTLPGGLERCANRTIAVVAHCMALRFESGHGEPACESEEIQQYLRLVK
ncbi:MAG TPA: hypothetical protein VFK90_13175 [Anaeromyxobacter sp.]|nr:hypothetical protein [Anaeromyxobacter sp.]